MKRAGRPKAFKQGKVVSVRFDSPVYDMLKDIAASETMISGRLVTALELIRMSVRYVFQDNERLREAFRRNRQLTVRPRKRFK